MSQPINFGLIENALDYLLLAGEQAREGSVHMLKHAMANLADGVELLLKARLELKDWCLVFRDVDQASREKYESGDFQSVMFDQAIKRLENLCDITIDASHLAIIGELRQLRNRIRHFAVETDSNVASSLIVKVFSFSIQFVTEHLGEVHDEVESELEELRASLGEFQAFVDERLKEIEDNVRSAYLVVRCPFCLQDCLALGNDEVSCQFCGYKTDGEAAASHWADKFLGGQSLKDSLIEPQIRECPECHIEACLDMSEETEGRFAHVCFACGEVGECQDCTRCGSLCPIDSVGDMCDDCRDHVIASWD